jgi:Nickel responsive protein SCO4226-like
VTTYLIEAYMPGGDLGDLEDRARVAADAMSNEGHAVRYLRSVLVRADETCFHFFDAASEGVVAELARRAELPYERIVEAEEKAERISGRKG